MVLMLGWQCDHWAESLDFSRVEIAIGWLGHSITSAWRSECLEESVCECKVWIKNIRESAGPR
jgi:hypothetical protein